MIAVGAAVDYLRANNYKIAMQAALDAAILTGGKDRSTSWTQIALNAFNANLSSEFGPLPKPAFVLDPSTGNYVGTVTGSQPTSVLGIINISSISVTARAVAIATDDDNSFILALDHGQPKSHVWRVGKSFGDVSVLTSAGQKTALADDAILKPGNNILTGQNGRVLLVRGEETILIASNSVIGIPTDVTEGMSTIIHQWAGSILLAVEKRNDKHFEVITPYLAAVVKGTRFRVTVNKDDTSVEVLRGQVEVADFKSGQYALVLPGQAAKVFAQGTAGLSLSGPGSLNPILRGMPRKSSVNPVALSNEGLSAPASTLSGQQVRVASSIGEAEQVPAASARTPAKENSWNFGLNTLGEFFSNADSWRNRNEDPIFGIVFAGAVGIAVGIAAQWLLRRRKQKSM